MWVFIIINSGKGYILYIHYTIIRSWKQYNGYNISLPDTCLGGEELFHEWTNYLHSLPTVILFSREWILRNPSSLVSSFDRSLGKSHDLLFRSPQRRLNSDSVTPIRLSQLYFYANTVRFLPSPYVNVFLCVFESWQNHCKIKNFYWKNTKKTLLVIYVHKNFSYDRT